MELQILGPVRLRRGTEDIALGVRKQRFTLAVLALEANRLVPVERLTDLIWPDSPPATARGIIQGHISSLRAVLAASGAADDGVALRREGPGYLLACDPMTVDAHQFDRLTGRAVAEPDPTTRLDLLDRALALWRGPALAGTAPEPVRAGLSRRLEENRLAAAEHRLAALIDLGRSGDATGELIRLTAEYPDRHRLTELLMTALHRAGRSTQALAVYRAAKHRLAEDLGLDPPPALQVLELSILRAPGERAAVPSRAPQPAPPRALPPPVVPLPAQLPSVPAGFIGRLDPLARLDKLLGATTAASASGVAVICGTAGIGKTTLAVHWARTVAHRFPDGQLYVDLRGFSPCGPAMDPATAVCGFLDALGVAPDRIPPGPDAQFAAYRSLLATRKLLVVLDNAADSAQVAPLLPGAAGCLVLVTSRNQLTSLIATNGAQPIALDLLTRPEAIELLAHRLGREPIEAEPPAVERIVAACARLPLALALVAAHAAVRSGADLAALADTLHDREQRWQPLAGDAAAADLRTAFALSYRALSPAAGRLFRLLGVHPGPDITGPAAASLVGQDPAEVHPAVGELVRTYLVTEHRPGRYVMHDLLRGYAGELARTQDAVEGVLDRVLDHYLHTAYGAARLINPARDPIVLAPPGPGVYPEPVADHQAARRWFSTEEMVLMAAVREAGDSGRDVAAWQLAWTLWSHLNRVGHWHHQVIAGRTAMAAARRVADPLALVLGSRIMALGAINLGHFDEADAALQHALALATAAADRTGQARVHLDLGLLFERRGEPTRALTHAEQALRLFRATGDRAGQARALNAVGWCHAQLGDYRGALAACQEALPLYRQLGHRRGYADTHDSIGYAHHCLGDHRAAISCYRLAVADFQDLGDRYNEAKVLAHLGDDHLADADTEAAGDAWRRAAAILTDLNHPDAGPVRAKLTDLRDCPA